MADEELDLRTAEAEAAEEEERRREERQQLLDLVQSPGWQLLKRLQDGLMTQMANAMIQPVQQVSVDWTRGVLFGINSVCEAPYKLLDKMVSDEQESGQSTLDNPEPNIGLNPSPHMGESE